jgi:hypothetical protein
MNAAVLLSAVASPGTEGVEGVEAVEAAEAGPGAGAGAVAKGQGEDGEGGEVVVVEERGEVAAAEEAALSVLPVLSPSSHRPGSHVSASRQSPGCRCML